MSDRIHLPVLSAPKLREIHDGIFAYIQPDGGWWVNNTGFMLTSDGVISIDTCATVRRTQAYQDAIREVTPKPVRTVVNTHHHGDHTFGNFMFPEATIVAHERTRRALLDYGLPGIAETFWHVPVDFGELSLAAPFLTFSDSVQLWLDDSSCTVQHVGRAAHTDNDSIVWIPEKKTLFAGDLLFNGGTPLLLNGSITGSIAVLRDVLKPLGAETVVPGHGEVAGPELIDQVLDYLVFVLENATEAKELGLSPYEAARDLDLGRFAHWLDSERIAANFHRAYAELDGVLPGGAIDVHAALADMVKYHGGPITPDV